MYVGSLNPAERRKGWDVSVVGEKGLGVSVVAGMIGFVESDFTILNASAMIHPLSTLNLSVTPAAKSVGSVRASGESS